MSDTAHADPAANPATAPWPPLVLDRLLAAPRATVWRALTEPAHLARWWGPGGFTAPRCEIDLRPGGQLAIDMRGPDGTIYRVRGEVRETVAPERLAILTAALDADGAALFEVLHTIRLADEAGGTRLVLEARVIALHSPLAADHLRGQTQGWTESLDRLAASLAPASHGAFTIERDVAAPPARVFAAFTTAAGKEAWFSGPQGEWTALRREFDFRAGGRERVVGRWKSGLVSDFDATYHDIVPDRRIVYAYAMRLDERLISVSLATIEFAHGGRGTRLTITEQGTFLDGYADGGSREHGTASLLDRLEASLAPPAGSA